MSHLESSTTGGSGGYKEPAVIKLIGETIEEWDKLDLKDDTLWRNLHYELEEITEEQIETVPTPYLQYFRDFLQRRGVYVPRYNHVLLHESIYDTIHQQKPGRWPHHEILEYLEITGNFHSPNINRYLWENGIPSSRKITPRRQINPFLHPTTPPPITKNPPQSRTPTPTTPNRTPTPIPGTTTPPAMRTSKPPPNDLCDNSPDQPLIPPSRARDVPATALQNQNVATLGILYNNKNKNSNQTDNNRYKNRDNKPKTAKNNRKPIIKSIKGLLTEFRQLRQPSNRANTSLTATPTLEVYRGGALSPQTLLKPKSSLLPIRVVNMGFTHPECDACTKQV
jgi:hypothetical protein